MSIDVNDPNTWPASARDLLLRRQRATAGNPDLLAVIRERIRAAGRIAFAEFMRLALYHPQHGYYAAPGPKVGRDGDFLTAPETHPAFGALVCRFLTGRWQALGSPQRFGVVEGGPGTGALAEQVLRYAEARFPAFRSAIHYTLIETSPSLRAEQGRRLAGFGAVQWADGLESLPDGSVEGCLLTNELLDALPVHRVVASPAGLQEIYVTLDAAGDLVEETGPLSTPAIEEFFASSGAFPPAGCEAEAGLAAVEWYRQAARKLRRGCLLTIDYGHPAAELYTAERPRGTLLCYHRHTANEEPLRRVGCQDITAHVNFTALIRAGEEAGLHTDDFRTQAEWLAALGLPEWLHRRERWPEGETHSFRDLSSLADPVGLGRLRVLVQRV